MDDERRDLGQEDGDGRFEGGGRGGEVRVSAEEADHINHAHLPDASARANAAVVFGGGCGGGGVVTAPYADVAVVGELKGGEGVGDGGGYGQRPQRRLPETEVRYPMRQ